MFTEFAIFAAFYAVAFVAHFVHALVTKEHRVDAHRFAAVVALFAKAAQVALHDYMLHAAEVLVHVFAH